MIEGGGWMRRGGGAWCGREEGEGWRKEEKKEKGKRFEGYLREGKAREGPGGRTESGTARAKGCSVDASESISRSRWVRRQIRFRLLPNPRLSAILQGTEQKYQRWARYTAMVGTSGPGMHRSLPLVTHVSNMGPRTGTRESACRRLF